MGYCVDMNVQVVIPTSKVGDCLKAINELHKPEVVARQGGGGSYSGGRKTESWYGFVNNPGPDGFPSLEEAFSEWRYDTKTDAEGVHLTGFNGEKWADDEVLFKGIAPFATGMIEVHGEDGALWGYKFSAGQVAKLQGRVTYK